MKTEKKARESNIGGGGGGGMNALDVSLVFRVAVDWDVTPCGSV